MHAMNHAKCCLTARRTHHELTDVLAIEGSDPSLSIRHTLARGKLFRPEPPRTDARAESALNQAETRWKPPETQAKPRTEHEATRTPHNGGQEKAQHHQFSTCEQRMMDHTMCETNHSCRRLTKDCATERNARDKPRENALKNKNRQP